MAKKKPASKPPASQRKKTVSVKRIVAEIDKTLAKLEPAKATAQAKRTTAVAKADPQAYALDRVVKSLRAARDVVEGTCVPGFDIPF